MVNPEPLILKEVAISLKKTELVRLDETIMPGAVVSIMGPSGSGKSTLLAYIAGFLDPVFRASGDVILGGRSIVGLRAEQRNVGMLFQDPLLFPHMSVEQNLLFAMPPDIKKLSDRKVLAADALSAANMEGYGDADPATLSGGQKARIALIRVMLAKPRVLLLDEPFSKLDTKLRDQTREFVFQTAKESRLPVLMVTHDEADAEQAGGKVVMIGDS